MSFELFAFWVFASITAGSALAVISLKNPVYAALCLVLTFFSTACLFILLQAEFLGIALVLVYVGAVMVLFLFVVMMIDINTASLREGFARYFPFALVVAVVMAAEMIILLMRGENFGDGFPTPDPAVDVAGMSNIEWIGQTLFREYILPFEIAAVILTVAIIAAITLTLRRRPGTKHQDPGRQVMVRRQDRVRVLKMKPEGKESQE
ncbi:MAG: NADH-quinone oxidoreductase subunit J [Lysobacteraceae bacterium]